MPSKRTNDSVDRILEEVNRRQTAAAVRAGANDQQINEILRSLGRGDDPVSQATAQLGPLATAYLPKVELETTPEDTLSGFAFSESPAAEPAQKEAPARRPAAPAPRPAEQPARRPAQKAAPRPAEQPARQAAARPAPCAAEQPAPVRDPDFSGSDITQSGEIKVFLGRAMQEQGVDDPADLGARKEQFRAFFKDTVAVVPDENGHLRAPEPEKKRRGLFGGRAEDTENTGMFVPINVALNKPAPQPATPAEPQAEEPARETLPEHEIETATAPRRMELVRREEPRRVYSAGGRAKKKRFSLFGGRKRQEEDLPIPEPREETEEPAPGVEPAPAAPQPAPERGRRYQSKYAGTRRVHSSVPEDTFASASMLEAINQAKRAREEELEALRQPAAAEPPVQESRGEMPTGIISLGGETAEESTASFMRQFAAAEPAAAEPATAEFDPAAPAQAAPRKKRDTVEFLPGKKPKPRPAPEMPLPEHGAGPVGEPVMTPTRDVPEPEPPEQEEDLSAFAEELPGVQTPDATTGFSVRMDQVAAPAASTGEVALDLGAELPDAGRPEPGAPEQPFAPAPAAPASDFVSSIAQSINAQPTLDSIDTAQTNPGKYTEAARTLTEDATGELPEDEEQKPGRRPGRIRLAGTPEDEEEAESGAPGHPFRAAGSAAVPHDYEKTEDAPQITKLLDKAVLTATVSTIAAGAIALVLLYLGTAAMSSTLPMPSVLDPLNEPAALFGVMTVLLAGCCGLCWHAMLEGLRGLARAPSADTMPALAAVASLVQLVGFLAQPGWYSPKEHCLMAGMAALLLFTNSLGHMLEARTVRANFSLVSAGVDHAAAYRLRDSSVVHTITQGLGEAKPNVMVSRPVQLFKGFLKNSYVRRTSDKNQQQYAWILGGCALLCLVLGLVLHSKEPGRAISAMAAVLCLGAPLASTLLSALPAQLMQRSAARVGAVIPGWKDIRQIGRANVIQVTARDLFPGGCVQLGGIKMARQENIDTAITSVASVLVEASPTLRDVFLNMIGGNRKLLHKVDDLKSVPGRGCIGWIDGERVLVGNRWLMQEYDVRVPSEEFEKRYTASRHRIIYLAVSGNLYAVFLMSYARDNDTAAVLEGLHRRGISLVVSSDDFNIDSGLIEALYSLPSGSVKVLDAEATDALAPATAWLPESEGNMLHLGSFASFVGGLEAAAGAAESERRASLVLAASVLISCLLGVVLSLAGGITTLALPVMVLYQAGWCALALIFPLIQKY